MKNFISYFYPFKRLSGREAKKDRSIKAMKQSVMEESNSAREKHEQKNWDQFQQKQSKLLRHFGLNNSLLGFIVIILCLTLLKLTASFSIPIIVGLLIFAMLFPHVERLHEKGNIPYTLSCVIVLIVFHLIVFLLLILISQASFNSLLGALPVYQAKLQTLLESILQMVSNKGLDVSQFVNWDLLGKGLSSASGVLTSLSGGISGFFSSLFTIFLITLFMLLEGKYFFNTIERSFSLQQSSSIIHVYHSSVEQISSYLQLKTFISFLTGAIISTGLWFMGVDFPLVWGILAFALNFIPSIGSIIHTLLVGLFSVLQFNNQLYSAVVVILFLLGVQFLIGNFLEPKVQGNRLRLSPVFILLSLYIWSYIWGIPGMLLSVPILSVIKIICKNLPNFQTWAYFLENSPLPDSPAQRDEMSPKNEWA
ncbi:MAG: AI-2E family transporter [Spirochaetota bacterium]